MINLSNDASETVDNKLSLHVVGKLLTEKPINFKALKCTITNVRNLKDDVIIRSIDVKIFI